MATSRTSEATKLPATPASLVAFVDAVVDYAIFMLDADGFVLTWNQGAQRLKGYRPEEIIGQHFSRFYAKEDVDAGKCELELATAEKEGRFEEEGWRYRKDGSRFWANVTLTALKDDQGRLEGFAKVTRDLTDRRAAEESARHLAEERAARVALESTQARLKFLAEAGRVLGQSLDYAANLTRVAQLAVPVIADWSTVALGDSTLGFRRAAVVHGDPAKAELVREYEQRFPPTEHRTDNYAAILHAGRPVLYPVVSEAQLGASAQSPDHLRILRGLGVRSCIMVPLVSRGGPIGVISLMRSEPGQEYTELDLALAEELASRAAVAIDNARLFEAERRARAEAERERARLTSLFRQAPAIVNVQSGPDHVFELVHPLTQQLVGDREIQGLPVRQAMPELEGQGFFEALDQVYATGEPFNGVERPVRFLQPDGSSRETIFNFVYQPWHDGEGRIAGVMTFAFDVTGQVEARRRENVLAEKLRHGEELFRSLVDNVPQLAWSAQPDGHIDFYNGRWYEYTGTTFEQMEGWGWQSVHDPAHLPRVLEQWTQAVAQGIPFEMEFPLRAADGTFHWFLTRVRPLKNAEGEVLRWFGTNTNIDDQRRQAAALQEAVEVRDTFLSVASHELKTPLTPMALRLQALEAASLREPDSTYNRQVRQYIDTARRQIGKLTALVNDLLDVSRIVSGQFKMELEEVDAAALVQDVASRFESQAQLVGSELSVQTPQRFLLRTARLRLEQVLTNLLDNAIKYGPGKPVTVVLAREADTAVLTVLDQGIGVPPEHLHRIFDRFERAVSDRNYGGLGLGLYITRTIVEALGGTVGVRSQPGQGSAFRVVLPVRGGA